MATTLIKPRIQSLDLLRGLVMIIMALDHVRDYFHRESFLFDPTDIEFTNLPIFFTRFISHYCAPVFIFLAGTSAFLVGQKKDGKELSIWLLKRGFWLIIVEMTIMKLGWNFQLNMNMFTLQVIWVLGLCMICLAGLIHLPKKAIIATSIIVIFTHNFLDGYSPEGETASILWSFFHSFRFNQIGPVTVILVYPLIPWVFVMALGYHFGNFYTKDYPAEKRRKFLIAIGFGMIGLFLVIRFFNLFGDSNPFVTYDEASKTLMSFLNVSKYPPSTLYLLVTLGPALLFLAFTENVNDKVSKVVGVFGRVPMFYYVLHVYVIHLAALFFAVFTGYQASDMVVDVFISFEANLKGYGVSLFWVYVTWAMIIAGLYPVSKWYDRYKQTHREKWWLSYL